MDDYIREIKLTSTLYQANDGTYYLFRVRKSVADLTGVNPDTVPYVEGAVVKLNSRDSKASGIHARGVILQDDTGTISSKPFLPVLSLTAWNSSNYAVGATINYKNKNWRIVERIPERIN